jgi:predicted TIM-barrel fold metal-dependent hydrolase
MSSSVARIDVHQHLVPPLWRRALAERGLDSGGAAIPNWAAPSAIAMMDTQEIATGILSVTAPGVHLGGPIQARALARSVNEFGAELLKDRPDRMGMFASIPLPDVDAALQEAEYALDTLSADGVVLMSNAHGRYLGEPDFEPLWAELNRRAAVVFIHPAQPALPRVDGTPAPLLDYVFDTTRTAVNLVLNGVMNRYPDLKVILSHGGGFVPYAAYRFSALTSMLFDPSHDGEQILRDLKRFYFDTALASSPSSLPSLLAFAEPDHVLYGSDWPFAPEQVGTVFNHHLDTYRYADEGHHAAINRGNAEILFPRLSRAHASVR